MLFVNGVNLLIFDINRLVNNLIIYKRLNEVRENIICLSLKVFIILEWFHVTCIQRAKWLHQTWRCITWSSSDALFPMCVCVYRWNLPYMLLFVGQSLKETTTVAKTLYYIHIYGCVCITQSFILLGGSRSWNKFL